MKTFSQFRFWALPVFLCLLFLAGCGGPSYYADVTLLRAPSAPKAHTAAIEPAGGMDGNDLVYSRAADRLAGILKADGRAVVSAPGIADETVRLGFSHRGPVAITRETIRPDFVPVERRGRIRPGNGNTALVFHGSSDKRNTLRRGKGQDEGRKSVMADRGGGAQPRRLPRGQARRRAHGRGRSHRRSSGQPEKLRCHCEGRGRAGSQGNDGLSVPFHGSFIRIGARKNRPSITNFPLLSVTSAAHFPGGRRPRQASGGARGVREKRSKY